MNFDCPSILKLKSTLETQYSEKKKLEEKIRNYECLSKLRLDLQDLRLLNRSIKHNEDEIKKNKLEYVKAYFFHTDDEEAELLLTTLEKV
jgi:hypothetical protein